MRIRRSRFSLGLDLVLAMCLTVYSHDLGIRVALEPGYQSQQNESRFTWHSNRNRGTIKSKLTQSVEVKDAKYACSQPGC
ncbi:MAG: hypothetical protein EBZ06_11705 [Betaproteobacteria bacterium]|nr:hypothetical protein [Betaproteobacteria bacterium]NCV57741.1 hypothetical protein [Betaproteobacteria bacterium]NCW19335.1 hypothetical protein [Betaproteobacteria bacterium]NCW50003.1 hypothetical protein [Betaproteobacteria bacterium]NCX12507.1 hypothetical protein [Betaproteobacteria bacterium]